MKRTYYKVVHVHNEEKHIYTSVSMPRDYRGLSLLYKVGEVTIPRFGHIFAFSNIHDALAFSSYYPFSRVFECRGTRAPQRKWIAAFIKDVKNFWNWWNWRRMRRNCIQVPGGTIFLKDCTLLKEV